MSALTRLFFDPVDSDRDRAARRYQFVGDRLLWLVPLAAGAVALVLALVFGLGDMQRFFYAYLVGWTFAVSISIGALFFVMIQHITKARWSVTLRRIPEMLAANFPLLALLGIPVLIGYHDLYHWSHHDLYEAGTATYDSILAGKAGYFFFPFEAGGLPFFWIARYVIFFALTSLVASKLYGYSVRNDTEPSAENTIKLRWWSAFGIPIVAVLVSFFAYDMLMSLEPHWFSTMWGVYYFAGGWLGSLCLITFLALLYKKSGMLQHEVTKEHIQDMGKFMFAFVVFWTYIAFSQYMLYWYGNLPEETLWFHKRAFEGYGTVGKALVWVNFVLPFLILLPRFSKRLFPLLATMAVWLLVMHWIDLWWIAMPSIIPAEHGAEAYSTLAPAVEGVQTALASLQTAPLAPEALAEAGQTALDPDVLDATLREHLVPAAFHMVDVLCGLGFALVLVGATILRSTRHAMTPYNDPYFNDSLRFENV
ncbi:hypothetical protein [Rubricoccus marinus]|uniref:Quinol:cytochrome C oxidoreductase n=1 Tax=Rubricoccus marinus TaxID=716817 RepID=A0A259U071_9BACT|nr:hypothetical protein [Rubricoccus marinus]OZC03237.1 hypothetical protein BSZ36_09770 [Rubricoccus marinus]